MFEREAITLRANGAYQEALSFFERAVAHEATNSVANQLAPGRAPWLVDIACLHWLLGDHSRAIQMMHNLVTGILDGSVKYGDAAGGMSQGLLLYYMGITAHAPEEASFALEYLQNRVNQLKRIHSQLSGVWPCPIALYHLGDISFESVMQSVNRQPKARQTKSGKLELGRRRRLLVALFNEAIKNRANGDENRCIVRMRECLALEDPSIDQEWYLARNEVQKRNRSG